MKFISHLLFGIIVLILFYFLLNPSLSILVPLSITLLVGAVLPDLDHPFSYIRKAFRFAAFVILSVLIFLFLVTPTSSNFIQQQCLNFGCNNMIFLIQAVVAVILSFILVMIIDFFIPFHRGPLHGIIAAVGYAIICGIITANYFSDYILIAFAGLIGYLTHIIPDALFKE